MRFADLLGFAWQVVLGYRSRTLMILLVVNMHACVTYSHVGSWYRMEDPEPAMPIKIAFMFWQGHLQAFFMGLLYLLTANKQACFSGELSVANRKAALPS